MKKKYHIYKMDVKMLNIVSIILLLVVCILTYFINNSLFLESIIIDDYFKFIILFFLYTCFHEILHSLAYFINGAHFKNIVYGCALEKGVLYCLCKENISKKNIMISLMYPLFFIGIITYILSIILNLKTLLLLSILNIAGCSGDIIMFLFIGKLDKKIEYSEFDDEVSFGIYTDKDISKIKHFGLKYDGICDKLKRDNKKKIQISKFSYIIFIILIGLMVLGKIM